MIRWLRESAATLLTRIKGVDGLNSGLDADLVRATTPTAFGLSAIATASASTARQLLGLHDAFWNVKWMVGSNPGAVGDGVTDDTAAVKRAMVALEGMGGGELLFPRGTFLITEKLSPTITEDVEGDVRQTTVTFRGVGHDANNGATRGGRAPVSGTILDLRVAGNKIETLGFSQITIRDLCLADLSENPAGGTFVFSTYTRPIVKNVYFYTGKQGTACNTKGVVLGGTGLSYDEGTASVAQGFQGYNPIVDSCFFAGISTCYFGQTYCNGGVFSNNMVWVTCGGSACYELVGATGGGSCAGNTTLGNTIECYNYVYVFKLTYAVNNRFRDDKLYDAGDSTTLLAYFRFEVTANNNRVDPTYYDPAKPLFSDAAGDNRIDDPSGGQTSYNPEITEFNSPSGGIVLRNRDGLPAIGPRLKDQTGGEFKTAVGHTTDHMSHFSYYTPSGGGGTEYLEQQWFYGSGILRHNFHGAGPTRFDAVFSDLELFSSGGVVWAGNDHKHYFDTGGTMHVQSGGVINIKSGAFLAVDATNLAANKTIGVNSGGTAMVARTPLWLDATVTSGNLVYASATNTIGTASPDTIGLVDKASTQTIAGAKTFGSLVKTSIANAGNVTHLQLNNTSSSAVPNWYVKHGSPGNFDGYLMFGRSATINTWDFALRENGNPDFKSGTFISLAPVGVWDSGITSADGNNGLFFYSTTHTLLGAKSQLQISISFAQVAGANSSGFYIGSDGTPLGGIYKASASLDYGSISAGAEATLTVTVTGATTTSSVALGWSAALPDGIVVKQAWVSATDTVSVRVRNETGSPIDPSAVTCYVTVTK